VSKRKILARLLRDWASALDGNTAFVVERGAKFSVTAIGGGGGGRGKPGAVTIASSTGASGMAGGHSVFGTTNPPTTEQIAAVERGMQLAGIRKDGGSMRGFGWEAWRAEQDVCQHLDMRQYCEHCRPAEEGTRTSVGVGFPRPGRWWIRPSKANPGYIEVQLSLADSGKWVSVLLGVASWHAMKEAGDKQMDIADRLVSKRDAGQKDDPAERSAADGS
jgi:hypothetical protein